MYFELISVYIPSKFQLTFNEKVLFEEKPVAVGEFFSNIKQIPSTSSPISAFLESAKINWKLNCPRRKAAARSSLFHYYPISTIVQDSKERIQPGES
jgi:hypothetical protein